MKDTDLYIEDQGRGEALVFMHGFSFDSRMWCSQWDYFAGRYRVLAYDARGFGRSPLPGDKPSSAFEDLGSVLRNSGLDRCVLVAHSMAAITACEYCCRQPQQIRALVLVSPSVAGYPWPEAFMAQWVAYQELAAVDMDAARAAWLGSDLFTRACADPALADSMRRMVNDYSGWHWVQQTPVASSKLSTDDLQRIQQPVLLVNGGEDNPAFLDCGEQLAGQLSNCRHLVVPGTDHMCNMEQAELFNREIEGFIKDLAPV